jgi:DNA-directed RNA polymerase beta' subunit
MLKQFPKKEIKSIQFKISSPEDIIKQSVCKVDSHKINGAGGVYDPLMGPMEQNEICQSCNLSVSDCVGHTGHTELNTFVLHPMFLRYITNFLKCICIKCYRVILTQDHFNFEGILKYQGDNRFEKIIEKIEKIDFCYHCKSPKPKISFQQKTSDIVMKFKYGKNSENKSKTIIMNEYEIKKIFDNLPDDDVRLLGFKPEFMHPKNLVLSVLQIMPPRARPYVISDGNICDDDLTTSLSEILKANKNLTEFDISDTKKDKNIQTLKFRIKTMMNNSQQKARHNNGRALKGIKERLSGKDGLIRKNLMGKRRNQSARTVISADPTLRGDEIAIPPDIAKNLTTPEIVASFNINFLQNLVDNGLANFVIRGNSRINLKYATLKKGTSILWEDTVLRDGKEFKNVQRNFKLLKNDKIKRRNGEIIEVELDKKKQYKIEIGDIVETHLRDGQIIYFNRQPTLHSGSMLAKRIVVRPGKSFRMNLQSTKSFGADFDGDLIHSFCSQQLDAIKVV